MPRLPGGGGGLLLVAAAGLVASALAAPGLGLKMPPSYYISGDMTMDAEGTVFNYQMGLDAGQGMWFTKRMGVDGGDQVIQKAGWVYVLVSNNQTAPNNWDCWAVNSTLPAPKMKLGANYTLMGEVLLRGVKVSQYRRTFLNGTHKGSIVMQADNFFDTTGPVAIFKGVSTSPSGNFFIADVSTATPPPAEAFEIPSTCTKKPLPAGASVLSRLSTGSELFQQPALESGALYAAVHNAEKERHGYTLKASDHPHPRGQLLAVEDGEGRLRAESDAAFPTYRPTPGAAIPDAIDRVAEGWTTSVRDQGTCGGCWAFATAACLEVNTGIVRGEQQPQMSVQQLIDCARGCDGFKEPICLAPTRGCHGGWPPVVYRWLRQHGSLSPDAEYSYRSTEGRCLYNAKGSSSSAVDFLQIPRGNETAMKAAVAEHGSVTVVISTPMTFDLYEEGVFDDPKCGTALNHAVTVVGYGRDEVVGKDYWLIKNSWSNRWGMDGYVKMVRGKNMCGIANWSFTLVPSS